MATEVRIPNPTGELLPGMYAQLALTLATPRKVFEIPSTALLNDSRGLQVAVIDDASKLHLVPVVIERDTGATLEISSGLQGTEKVVRLASAAMSEGQSVELIP
jgi:hypothetical protein